MQGLTATQQQLPQQQQQPTTSYAQQQHVVTSNASPAPSTGSSLFSSLQGNPTGYGQSKPYIKRTDKTEDQDIDKKLDDFVAKMKNGGKRREYNHRDHRVTPYSRTGRGTPRESRVERRRETPPRRIRGPHTVTDNYQMKVSPKRNETTSSGGSSRRISPRRRRSRSRARKSRSRGRRSRSRKRDVRRKSPARRGNREEKEVITISPENDEKESNISFRICKKKKNTDPVVARDGNHGDAGRENVREVQQDEKRDFKVTVKVKPSPVEPPPPGTY